MRPYVNLLVGDHAPWFQQRSPSNPKYVFDTTAGRYIVLCFYVTAGDVRGRAAIRTARSRRRIFDDEKACFFGISIDPEDERQSRVAESLPGLRFIWDFDGSVSKLYGAIPKDCDPAKEKVHCRRLWLVLDPTLRIIKIVPFANDGRCATEIIDFVEGLPAPSRFAGFEVHAPILVLPNVFEPDLCRHLVEVYEASGGEESGFMRDVDGMTALAHDHSHKRRRDCLIRDPELQGTLQNRVSRRVLPEILKVHQFRATRMERYIVSCYSAEDGGHFRAHRDNTTKGTAHRRFAVSINLNAEFEGGEITFPEYGPRSLKPPPGGAVVFSCSLLHAVSKVTSGKRYAFLPFLYDEAGARIREENDAFLEGGGSYKAGPAGESS
jgi:peroxiredoxin/predicted 2-oxoglutarate/Fe(II)-dependent dioxygenase YbiX